MSIGGVQLARCIRALVLESLWWEKNWNVLQHKIMEIMLLPFYVVIFWQDWHDLRPLHTNKETAKKYSCKKRKAVQTSYNMLYWPDFLFLVFCHVIYVWSGILLSRHTFTKSLTVDIVILSLFPGKAFRVEFKKVAFTSRWHYWYADNTLASVLHLTGVPTGVRNKKKHCCPLSHSVYTVRNIIKSYP